MLDHPSRSALDLALYIYIYGAVSTLAYQEVHCLFFRSDLEQSINRSGYFPRQLTFVDVPYCIAKLHFLRSTLKTAQPLPPLTSQDRIVFGINQSWYRLFQKTSFCR